MAQYNLVGYNSAPTNVEYDIMKSGMDKTPRTNWAEYSLKKDQLKEQKKQNRIQNALNIVNTIATGVNTYENVLNSELQRKTRELQNQELSLDIQSKTIDVNKKSEDTKKDLDFATKVREIQETKDWNRASELLADPETAIRNKNVTKTLIEQLRTNGFKDGADQLYTALFPDEKYQRDQDALKLQTQKDIAYAQIGAANQRAALSREQNERHFQLTREDNYVKWNMQYGNGGLGGIDARAINKDFLTKADKANTAFMNTPTLSSFAEDNDFDFMQTLKDPNSDIDYTVTDTNEIKQLLQTRSDLERAGKLDTFPADSQAKLESIFGKNFEIDDSDELLEKNQLLEIFYNGQSHYKLVDRQTSKDILAARNANIKRQGLLALNELNNSTQGDISSFGSGKLYSLAELPSTTLKGELDKFPRLLESATPQQRQTKAFKKLEAAVQRVSSQTSTITDIPQATQQNQPQTTTLPDIIDNTIKTNPNLTKSDLSQKILPSLTSNQLNAFAKQGAQLAGKNVSVDTMSDTMKKNYAAIALEASLGDQLQGLTSKKVQTVTTNAETFTDELDSLIARYMTSESTDSNIAAQIDKWHRTNISDLKSSDYIKREDRRNAENTAYEKEIYTVADKLGALLDEYDIEVSGGKRWERTIYTLDGTTAVNNLVNTTLRMIKEEEAGKRRVGTTPIGTRKGLLEYLAGTLDRAIDKAREQSDRR